MEEKVLQYIREQKMIREGDRVIVGVSGGADSVALFTVLSHLRARLRFEMCAVHVNHELRGEAAEEDERFVRELCSAQQILCFVFHRDVAALEATRGIGTEEAGRLARQEAFAQQMRDWKGTKLALAHHRNDQAETVLHHLCRGSGLAGLGGIRPVEGTKISPFLCLDRDEIEVYLVEQGISWRTDSSNEDPGFTRNRIRHEILPLLERDVNRQSVRHMAQTAERIQQIEAYLQRQSAEMLHGCARYTEDGVRVSEEFFAQDPLLQAYGAMQIIGRVGRDRRDVTAVHVQQILALHDKQVGKSLMLPRGLMVRREYQGLSFLAAPSGKQQDLLTAQDFCPGQTLYLTEGILESRLFSYKGQKIPQKIYTKWLNYDKIGSALQLRTRRSGDYMVIDQNGGKKKLKDLLIDDKIPRRDRDRVPILAQGDEVLWIIGGRISEACKIQEDTRTVLEVTYQGGKTGVRKHQ